MEEYGSFDWYNTLADRFFRNLVRAVHHADMFNLRQLRLTFLHIVKAHDEHDWSKAPGGDTPIVINTSRVDPEKKKRAQSNSGSFNWYLHQSGHFVTYMANVILYADKDNLEMLRSVYPQMVSAFELDDWDICPSGFSPPTYNGEPDN